MRIFNPPCNRYPARIVRDNRLPEPLAACAAHVFYALDGMDVVVGDVERLYYDITSEDSPKTAHFAKRLTPGKAQEIIDRVIRNAEMINADPERLYLVESLGVFGSVLAGAASPGDVDMGWMARWRYSERSLNWGHMYGIQNPLEFISRGLRRGNRMKDLSAHYLGEIGEVGFPYRIIWTREEGLVERPAIVPERTCAEDDILPDQLPLADACVGSFQARCEALEQQLPPKAITIPRGTSPLTYDQWLSILAWNHPVTELAHRFCLPEGRLKDKINEMAPDVFQTPRWARFKDDAKKMLYPYLAASARYGEWTWEPDTGLVRAKNTTELRKHHRANSRY